MRFKPTLLGANSSTCHCAWSPTPHMVFIGKLVACPRAAQKTATYRSLRVVQLAALVPSAGTISTQVELRCFASRLIYGIGPVVAF